MGGIVSSILPSNRRYDQWIETKMIPVNERILYDYLDLCNITQEEFIDAYNKKYRFIGFNVKIKRINRFLNSSIYRVFTSTRENQFLIASYIFEGGDPDYFFIRM